MYNFFQCYRQLALGAMGGIAHIYEYHNVSPPTSVHEVSSRTRVQSAKELVSRRKTVGGPVITTEWEGDQDPLENMWWYQPTVEGTREEVSAS